jgi:hypothetical protein
MLNHTQYTRTIPTTTVTMGARGVLLVVVVSDEDKATATKFRLIVGLAINETISKEQDQTNMWIKCCITQPT